MAKVICDTCPCLNDYDDETGCNLGYTIQSSNPTTGDPLYLSDDCELEVVKFSSCEFRTTPQSRRVELESVWELVVKTIRALGEMLK